MAIQIIGYPQESNFCPKCGSEDIEINDQWSGDGLLKCKCGCRCYVIEAGEEE
jgi:hypothetical protein